jgi:hypothetical protein
MLRRSKLSRLAAATALFSLISITAAPLEAAAPVAQQQQQQLSIPIVGSGPGGVFNGVFQLQRFAVQDGAVVAVGLLTGTLTTAAGVVTSIARTVTLPIAIGEATCEILHLDLGPLSLDLLGLQIDLSRVVLDITAQAGAGNLLGNLLCAVAGLLDNPSGLSRLLNQILGALLG